MARSQHERQLVAVNRVHLAVVNDNTHITGIATCQRTLLHTFHDTFEDGRHKASINGTTNNRVDEYQFAAPFQVNLFPALDVHLELLAIELVSNGIRHTLCVWLHNQVNLTKLSCTTRLFLVTVVCTRHLGNGLTIWYLGFNKLNRQFLIVLKTPFQSAEVEFSLSVNDGLTQFLALLNHPCRIFLTHLHQCSHQFFSISLIDGFDGT